MKILEVKNVAKHFGGVYAVRDLSIGVEKGTVSSIVGPNGSGKTTLINLLSGLFPFDQGVVLIDGVKFYRMDAKEVASYGITRTFQEVRLFNQMTTLDNILVVLTERGVFRALFEKHGEFHLKGAENVLKQVGLWEKRNDLVLNLSYGQRKLLEIARALAMTHSREGAEIFLFDEPFAGLFPEMVKVVRRVMEELKKEGKTVILIEHNMELIRELSDYVFVMDSGELLAQGKPEEVLSKREVIDAYVGE